MPSDRHSRLSPLTRIKDDHQGGAAQTHSAQERDWSILMARAQYRSRRLPPPARGDRALSTRPCRTPPSRPQRCRGRGPGYSADPPRNTAHL